MLRENTIYIDWRVCTSRLLGKQAMIALHQNAGFRLEYRWNLLSLHDYYKWVLIAPNNTV